MLIARIFDQQLLLRVCHCRYGTLVLTRLWYMITSTRTVVMSPIGVDKLTVLIFDKPWVVLSYEMPSLLVVTDVGLYGLILILEIEDKSSAFHKLL